MIKMIIVFLSLFVIFFTGIDIFRRLTGKEKIKMLALSGYSLGVTVLVMLFVASIVILF
jgi:hypothetical protein